MAQPQAPAQVPTQGGMDDKFRQSGLNQLRNAAFGINTVDWLRDASGGKDDIPKAIKLSIQQNYFTYGQAFYFAVTAFLFGAGIWTIAFKFMGALDFNLRGEDSMEKLSFFFLGFWLASVATINSTGGQKQCDVSIPEVKAEHGEAIPCVDDYDCVSNCGVVPGGCGQPNESGRLCNHNSWKGWRKTMRLLAATMPMVLFISLFVYATQAQKEVPRVSSNERFISVSFGIGFGAAYMFVFS